MLIVDEFTRGDQALASPERAGVLMGPGSVSAGTAGDAVARGGPRAAVRIAANPLGAHQVGRHRASRVAAHRRRSQSAMACRRALWQAIAGTSKNSSEQETTNPIGDIAPRRGSSIRRRFCPFAARSLAEIRACGGGLPTKFGQITPDPYACW